MKAFRNQPIITKMRILTAAILIAFIFTLLIFFGTYWFWGSKQSMEENTENTARSAAASLDSTLKNIARNFVFIFGTDSFAMEMSDMLNSETEVTRNRVLIQDELMALSSSTPLAVSAMMYDTENDTAYTLFRDVVIPSRARVLWSSELSSINGIEILPERPSPIRGLDTVIPMVFPITLNFGGATIASDKGEFIAILLLDPEAIHAILPDGIILSAKNGTIITQNTETIAEVPVSDGGKISDWIYSYSVSLPFSNIRLTAYADFSARIRSLAGTTATSAVAAIAALIVFAIVFSFLLRRYVTAPIGKLKAAVVDIERGNYKSRASFKGSDELGELRDAISRMGLTIESQIAAIKEEEEKQTKTEMRLLTEQLTPHFLYNTLECIQQEIQNGNNIASSEMTRALSMYLRTVLSYGKETISIKNEIQHDMSYIRIMNGRFRQNISYQHESSPDIQNEEILKMVLQPFIENSVKHGFGVGNGSTWVQQPEITTSFSLTDGRIRIEISDNGRGFDESKFLSIMKGDEGYGHVGIRNTYLRLTKFYGEENVAVLVSSIPYFRSTVTIEVPLMERKED